MYVKLTNDKTPMFAVYSNSFEIGALFDTGAFISVYTESEVSFKSKFPKAVNTGKNTLIGGFGGKGDRKCSVYVIPELLIGDGVIYNLPVALCPIKNISAELILSSGIFRNWPFTIDYRNKSLVVDCPSNSIHAKYMTSAVNSDIISEFCVFIQQMPKAEEPRHFKLSRCTPVGGDCTCGYTVAFDREYTVGEFIDNVLCKRSTEWGYIEVRSNRTQTEIDYCSYSLGSLAENLHDVDLRQLTVLSATASGGYSRMDFVLYV